MLNHWDTEVTLRSFPDAVQNENGYVEKGEPEETTVWGDVKSVGRSEYYSAMVAGVNVSLIIRLKALDYDNQKSVTIGGKEYKVARVYQTTLDDIELTCSEVEN